MAEIEPFATALKIAVDNARLRQLFRKAEEWKREERWVIALHFHHYSYKDIGKAIGLSAAGARRYHKAALLRLFTHGSS